MKTNNETTFEQTLWEDDQPLHGRGLGLESSMSGDLLVPLWIDKDITGQDVMAIVQGGCDSGAYMPAVTYHEALATMSEHGDEILEYIEWDSCGLNEETLPQSWAGMAVHFVSLAVDCWAHSTYEALRHHYTTTEGESK